MAAVLAVAIVAVVVMLVVKPFAGTAAPDPTPTSSVTAASTEPEPTGTPSPPAPRTPAPGTSAAAPSPSVLTVTSVQTVSAAPPPPPVVTPVPAAGLAGLTERALDCSIGSGYLVQLASELDEAAFVRRVEEVRAAGQLPTDAVYLTEQGDCDLFTVQDNLWVLYAGPFATVDEACPDRLAGPVDGFVKGATQASKGTYVGCVCVSAATALPVLGAGSTGPWVGELQRALRVELDYDLGDLDSDPGLWGVFSGQTESAVEQVQSAAGLPVTGVMDALSWQAIQFGACRG